MRSHAQAFFHREWNTWTVGYYDPSRAGCAGAYSSHATEADAKRTADEYNAHGCDPIFCHAPGVPCRVATCSWGRPVARRRVQP